MCLANAYFHECLGVLSIFEHLPILQRKQSSYSDSKVSRCSLQKEKFISLLVWTSIIWSSRGGSPGVKTDPSSMSRAFQFQGGSPLPRHAHPVRSLQTKPQVSETELASLPLTHLSKTSRLVNLTVIGVSHPAGPCTAVPGGLDSPNQPSGRCQPRLSSERWTGAACLQAHLANTK